MLAAEKHLNLDLSVLRIASVVLKALQRKGVIEFEKARGLVIRAALESTPT